MKVFFHIALDEFAAEALGKFDQYADEVRDPDRELHFFVWGGTTPPPERTGFWSDIYPVWSFVLFSGENTLELSPDKGLALDRSQLAEAVAALFDTERFCQRLAELFAGLPKASLENAHFQPCVTISGSLADASTSGLILGLVCGFSRLRGRGLFTTVISQQPVYTVLGTGAVSSKMVGREDYKRVLVAQGLHDLQSFLRSGPGTLSDRVFPVYLVGDRPVEHVESDWPTQITLAALSLFGLTTSVLNDHCIQNKGIEAVNPFFFNVDSDQVVHFVNRQFDPEHPFSVVGALSVLTPKLYASRALAARFCGDYLKLFCQQPSAPSLEECGQLDLSQVQEKGFLRTINEWAASYFWQVSRKSLSQSEDPKDWKTSEDSSWFKISEFELLLNTLVQDRPWQRLLDWYEVEKLRKVPLEDWLGSIDELSESIEKGLLIQRQQYLENIQRQFMENFVETLDGAIDRIFCKSHIPPVNLRPHLFSQVFLGDVYLELNKALSVHQIKALDGAEARELDYKRLSQKVSEDKQFLEKALEALPSPAAVILRLLPLFFTCFGLFFFFPVTGGLWEEILFRVGGGLLTGVVASGLLFWNKAWNARSRILKGYRAWRDDYRRLLAVGDQMQRELALGRILVGLSDVLKWYYEDGSGELPLPDELQIHLELQPGSHADEAGEPILGRGAALRIFAENLSQAAESFSALSRQLDGKTFSSYLEFSLPDREGLERLYREEFKNFSPSEVMSFWERIIDDQAALAESGMVPFVQFPREHPSFCSVWRRTFSLPSSEDLLSEKTRQSSSALSFFHAADQGFRKRLNDQMKLPAQLKRYSQEKGGGRFAGTELYIKCNHLDALSMDVSGGESIRVILAGGSGDLIATEAGWENEFGRERLHASLQVTSGLSADKVISFPNEKNPTTPLGKAWLNFLKSPDKQAALVPVQWPASEGGE